MPRDEQPAMTTNTATIVGVSGGDGDDEATAPPACGARCVAFEVLGALAIAGTPVHPSCPDPAQGHDIARLRRTFESIARSVGPLAERRIGTTARATSVARGRDRAHDPSRARATLDVPFSARQAARQVAVVAVLREGMDAARRELLALQLADFEVPK